MGGHPPENVDQHRTPLHWFGLRVVRGDELHLLGRPDSTPTPVGLSPRGR